MAQYFGFIPSDELNGMIDEAKIIIESDKEVDYYPYRNEITQQIARELIDKLLVSLIDVIPNPERQTSMRKIVGTIERTTEKLLNVLLGKDINEDVMPTFDFLRDQTMFIDNDGLRRVGFKLPEDSSQAIMAGLEAVTPEAVDKELFRTALETLNDEALIHFITRFTASLKLGLIKRKAVPLAKVAIEKGLGMMLNKLLPQLPDEGLNRLAAFYRPFFVELSDE